VFCRARPEAAGEIHREGAESFIADVTDGAALTNAFAGAKAVYAMIPPNIGAPDVRAYSESVSDALRSAIGKKRDKVCRRSEQRGADNRMEPVPWPALHNLEKNSKKFQVKCPLPARRYFMENLLPRPCDKSMGIMAGPVREDLPLPMIANARYSAPMRPKPY